MAGVEEAQGPSRQGGFDAGERAASSVEAPQDIGGVTAVTVAQDVELGLLVRVQGATVVGHQVEVGAMFVRVERQPREFLTERGDLGFDLRQLVPASPFEDPEQSRSP
ncbi:hypothetical protein [Actinomadura luteofluorescens]|uniref:hypothetical protein n=1 Tax=Actinomadura luteofluorescens TaxID=46163 RepID=UPI003D9141CA